MNKRFGHKTRAGMVCAAVVFGGLAHVSAITAGTLTAAATDLTVSIVAVASDDRVDAYVRVGTSLPHIACSGDARQAGHHKTLPTLRTSKSGGREWHWVIAQNLPKSKLVVEVACAFPNGLEMRKTAHRRIGPGGENTRGGHTAFIRGGSLRVESWEPAKDVGSGGGNTAAVSSARYPAGQCTAYVAKRRPDLPFFADSSGNALNWAKSAKRADFPVGDLPAPGAVAVFQPGQYGAGIYGHVAYVTAVSGRTMTIAEANFRGRPEGSHREIAWSGLRFIYIKLPARSKSPGAGRPTRPQPTTTQPTVTQPTTTSPTGTQPATTVPGPPPTAGSSPAPPVTYAETTGGVTNTWTNFANAGGTQGPSIPSNATVEISCKVSGFRVADGNAWWYRIASGPWNLEYYASADAFYNNGQTTGSLHGTPFVDPAIPDC
jgi:surface antigen